MHEFSITETIIRRLLKQLQREHISKVQKITFRRSSTFSEEVLRQTLDILRVDTPLAGAELIVDVTVLNVTCACGYFGPVKRENLVGHMFTCPVCCGVREIDELHELELVEVIAEEEEVPDAVQT
jgi:Zn finger protein HypA/HybF involved in hydrogenase expression